MIIKYNIFEAKMSSILKYDGDNPFIKKYINDNFQNDVPLITSVYIEKYVKEINIDWNHSDNHNIILKIKDRTQLHSVSEFNQIFNNVIQQLFGEYFNEMDKYYINYDLFLTETNIHIFAVINYNNLFEENTIIRIRTINPEEFIGKHILLNFSY